MKYTTTTEIKSESKISKWIYAFDFFFLIIYAVFTYMLQTMVSSKLRPVFWIFSIIVAISLTIPSPYNYRRRMYKSVILYLKRDQECYRPIRIKDFNVEDENGISD